MSRPITYLATHFPAVSHTFIADEIDVLERLGINVLMVSINPVGEADIAADTQQRRLTTTYLKTLSKWRVLVTCGVTALRHPSVLAIPLRNGSGGARAALWRYFQLAEAIMTYRVMRRAGSTHVHAHFGQAPASVAWYTTEVALRHRTGRSNTWSMTIHGWHEFTGERDTLLREKIAAATFVVAISDFTRAQLYRIADAGQRDKIHVVRCGVDLARFSPRSEEPSTALARVAIVARLSPEKGHLVLVDAVATLRSRGLRVVVDVVGPEVDDRKVHDRTVHDRNVHDRNVHDRTVHDRNVHDRNVHDRNVHDRNVHDRNVHGYGAVVRGHAEAAGVADAFVWHGALPPDGVASVLAAANVFCLPTFAEGLPVVIMEAMARGVPVVTTYIAGIPELAVDHATALVVPAARPDLLANALAEVLADSGLRGRLVAAAASAVHEHHDIALNVKMLADLFTKNEEGARP